MEIRLGATPGRMNNCRDMILLFDPVYLATTNFHIKHGMFYAEICFSVLLKFELRIFISLAAFLVSHGNY